MDKASIMLLCFLVVVVCVKMYMGSGGGGDRKFTVYGTTWCGYTTKQRKHLDSKYGKNSHTFVDCDSDTCPKDIKSFPVTISTSGDKVVGFNTEL